MSSHLLLFFSLFDLELWIDCASCLSHLTLFAPFEKNRKIGNLMIRSRYMVRGSTRLAISRPNNLKKGRGGAVPRPETEKRGKGILLNFHPTGNFDTHQPCTCINWGSWMRCKDHIGLLAIDKKMLLAICKYLERRGQDSNLRPRRDLIASFHMMYHMTF